MNPAFVSFIGGGGKSQGPGWNKIFIVLQMILLLHWLKSRTNPIHGSNYCVYILRLLLDGMDH